MKHIFDRKYNNISIISCTLLFLVTFDMVQSCQGCILELDKYPKYILIAVEMLLFMIVILKDFFKDHEIDRKFILFIILLLLSIISTYLSHSRSFLYTILFCWVLRNEELKDVLRFETKALATVMILVFFSYLFVTYILKTNIIDFSREKTVRAIGFGHSNYLGIFSYNLTLMYLYANKNAMNIKKYVYLSLFSIIVFLISDCKSSLILYIVTLLLFLLENHLGLWYKKTLKFFAMYGFPLLGLIFFGIMYLYIRGNTIGQLINVLLTGRVGLACDALYTWGITPFGQYVSTLIESYRGHFIIETIYPYFLTYYGVIWFPIFSILIPLSIKNGEVEDFILMIIFSIYGLSEHAALSFVFVCSLLLFKSLFANGGVLDTNN